MEIRHLASTTSSRSYTVANAPFWKSKRATHRSRHGFILTQCTLLPPVFGKFAHQLETRFGIEPRTSPWGTFQEYFGVFCLGLIRSTCFYWHSCEEFMYLIAQVKLFLLFTREFFDLPGTLEDCFFPPGKFPMWRSNCGRMKMKNWVKEHLSVSRWWKTPGDLFFGC